MDLQKLDKLAGHIEFWHESLASWLSVGSVYSPHVSAAAYMIGYSRERLLRFTQEGGS